MRFGELPSPANDRSLRLHQGAVERALLFGQLEGLLLQLVLRHLQLPYFAGMGQSLGIECLLVPLLQLVSPPRDKGLELLILATKHCGKLRLTHGEVLFLGIQCGLMLVPDGLGRGSQVRRLFLGLLDVSHLHGELDIALGQFFLKGTLLLASLVEPGPRLSNARLEIHLRLVHR